MRSTCFAAVGKLRTEREGEARRSIPYLPIENHVSNHLIMLAKEISSRMKALRIEVRKGAANEVDAASSQRNNDLAVQDNECHRVTRPKYDEGLCNSCLHRIAGEILWNSAIISQCCRQASLEAANMSHHCLHSKPSMSRTGPHAVVLRTLTLCRLIVIVSFNSWCGRVSSHPGLPRCAEGLQSLKS